MTQGRRNRRVLYLFMAALMHTSPAGGAIADKPDTAAVSQLARLQEAAFLLDAGESRAAFDLRFGPPVHVRSMPVANPHEPRQRDFIHKLEYPAATVKLYRNSVTGREIVLAIAIRHAAAALPFGLHIGMAEPGLHMILGAPARRSSRQLVYPAAAAGLARVDVQLRDGRVSEFSWQFYAD